MFGDRADTYLYWNYANHKEDLVWVHLFLANSSRIPYEWKWPISSAAIAILGTLSKTRTSRDHEHFVYVLFSNKWIAERGNFSFSLNRGMTHWTKLMVSPGKLEAATRTLSLVQQGMKFRNNLSVIHCKISWRQCLTLTLAIKSSLFSLSLWTIKKK